MRCSRVGRWVVVLLTALALGACATAAPPLQSSEGQAIVKDFRERVARHRRLQPVVADYGPADISEQGIRLGVKVRATRWAAMARGQREDFMHDLASELQDALYGRQPQAPRSTVRLDLADDAGKPIGWVAVGGSEEGYAFEAR